VNDVAVSHRVRCAHPPGVCRAGAEGVSSGHGRGRRYQSDLRGTAERPRDRSYDIPQHQTVRSLRSAHVRE